MIIATAHPSKAISGVNISKYVISYRFSLISDLMTLSIASMDLRSSDLDLSACTRATGLEALFGWLWLTGQHERVSELYNLGRNP